MSKTDQACETSTRGILSGALRPDEAVTVASTARSRGSQRAGQTIETALSKHPTRLMDAVLDRDEPGALGRLQDHVGAATAGQSCDGPT
jgi:hypothetical protein